MLSRDAASCVSIMGSKLGSKQGRRPKPPAQRRLRVSKSLHHENKAAGKEQEAQRSVSSHDGEDSSA